MPIRILHIVEALGVGGGVEHGLANLIERMDRRRFEHVVCAVFRLGPQLDRYAPERVRVICLDQKGRMQVSALAKVIREVRPVIVHSRNWGTLEAVIAGRWVRSCSVIHSEHGVEVDPEAEPARRTWLRRMGFELAHRVVSVSYQLRETLASRTGFPLRKIQVIHNGVETQKFGASTEGARERSRRELGIGAEEFCIGCVGRLNRIKDYPTMLAAARLFSRSCDSWRLLIAGGGPELAALREIADADSCLQEHVRFLGPVEGECVPGFLRALDAYALPSLWEGISNSLLEAMAAGLPVVASDTGGNPEVVVAGESGLLFPVGDCGRLAEQLTLLYRQRELRIRMGARAAERIHQEFSLDSMVRNYEQMYTAFEGNRAA
jgi:sugar transferase (PEP-CTERM/EpsH1 system associated)